MTTASSFDHVGAESREGSCDRPRDPAIHRAIAQVVCQVLQEHGCTGLSFEMVASSAGVSRPTLCRRASSEDALVVALVDRYGLDPVADTGEIEADLTALQHQQFQFYNDPVFRAALPGVLSDIRTDQNARKAWNSRSVARVVRASSEL